ncbi:MAG TPA: YifB family Mg chelatase-like AAA ATPase [Acidimicrobiia bacterium]|jgi:magnesium chelatase family protein|nr:YifB family Mg chelatase-like AAA ATPase [Acidimicrobiia bacterium]
MYAATTSVALVSGDVRPVEVQVHVGKQNEQFKLSGLPDTAVREAKDRVRAAVVSSGLDFPNRAVTVNLAPAHLPKSGTDFDLAIALGVLAASREIPHPGRAVVVGELALDGSVRTGAGSIGAAVLSARSGQPCLVAAAAASEVATVPGSRVHGVASLAEAVDVLRSGLDSHPAADAGAPVETIPQGDLREVHGQALARRAIEVAAAGGHHLLMHGPPGGGKTMLARRLPGILPPLSDEEAVEVALIHAAAGLRVGISRSRPFRAPHHTASRAALVGGGTGVVVPGEVSLAHRGVLFVDEMAEFPRANLDTLRQPLEDGFVTVGRRGVTATFPAAFQLVAGTNPCPCGFRGDRRKPCECRPAAVSRYRQRVSGPLLDRFDMVVKVDRLETAGDGEPAPEDSAGVRRRVAEARRRLAGEPPEPDRAARQLLAEALKSALLTARGVERVRRVAVTIAALACAERVGDEHVAEAIGLRAEW